MTFKYLIFMQITDKSHFYASQLLGSLIRKINEIL